MRRSAITILCALCLTSASAYATGFGLREVSASSLGMSYAGAAANGDHASTLFFNPALLSDVKDFDVSGSATGILPTTSGTFSATTAAGTPVGGNATPHGIVNTALVPSFSVRGRLSDSVTVGLTFTAPWGMITDYSNNWVGRYYATMSDVKSYNVTSLIAYQPIPELSFGAGVQVQYTKGTLSKAIDFGTIGALYHIPGSVPGGMDGFVSLKADSWAPGYVLGVLWKPRGDFSLGLSYRSQINHVLGGNEKYTLDATGLGAMLSGATGMFTNTTAKADFSTPSVATVAGRWQINDQWNLNATVDWTGWSAFKQLLITSGNVHQPADLTDMNWKSSWLGSLGTEYKPNETWTLRLGTAYDETPTDTAYRTPGIPDSSRIWISSGVGYRWNQHLDFDLALAHLFSGHTDIALPVTGPGNAARGSLNGTVNMDVTLVGLEVTYH
jgi:long-chain fatty acid transport protein